MSQHSPQEESTLSFQESFIAHLIELRNCLVKAVLGWGIVFGVLLFYPGAAAIYDFLAQPMMHALPHGSKMIATGITAPFLVPIKIALLASFIVALPWVLYQAWAFVAPGLYAHEKRLILPLVFSSSVLFMSGVAFCYFFVFQKAFQFIAEFSPKSITVMPDMESYLDFIMTMAMAFGVTFEMPVVVIILVRMGLVTVEKLKSIRSYVIVGAVVVAGIVTPPDVVSQLALFVPMCLLYELGLFLAPIFEKATRAPDGE